MIKLFEMGDNYMVSLNKEWISTIPEFRRLLARDKGGPGDGSGKYKKQATREFTYIFHMYDFRSPFENYAEKEREDEALAISGLTKAKVNSDKDLWAAIEKYQERLANSSKTLQGLRSMKYAIDKMYDYLETIDFTERDEKGALVNNPKTIQAIIKDMPSVSKSLNELEELVKQEMEGEVGLRGDAEKGYDEDPEED